MTPAMQREFLISNDTDVSLLYIKIYVQCTPKLQYLAWWSFLGLNFWNLCCYNEIPLNMIHHNSVMTSPPKLCCNFTTHNILCHVTCLVWNCPWRQAICIQAHSSQITFFVTISVTCWVFVPIFPVHKHDFERLKEVIIVFDAKESEKDHLQKSRNKVSDLDAFTKQYLNLNLNLDCL